LEVYPGEIGFGGRIEIQMADQGWVDGIVIGIHRS
jgi:hypothetical protein